MRYVLCHSACARTYCVKAWLHVHAAAAAAGAAADGPEGVQGGHCAPMRYVLCHGSSFMCVHPRQLRWLLLLLSFILLGLFKESLGVPCAGVGWVSLCVEPCMHGIHAIVLRTCNIYLSVFPHSPALL